jgi:hypothetical protein
MAVLTFKIHHRTASPILHGQFQKARRKHFPLADLRRKALGVYSITPPKHKSRNQSDAPAAFKILMATLLPVTSTTQKIRKQK